MVQKYNEIIVLVHPLYDLINSEYVKSGEFLLTKDEILESRGRYKMEDREKFNYQLKQSLQAYGEEIIKQAKNKNAFLILYVPKHTLIYAEYQRYRERQASKLPKKLLKRFIDFCKTQFKGRCVISYKDTSKLDQPSSYKINLPKRFEKKLSLKFFGEYGDQCIDCARKFLSYDLKNKGHDIDYKLINDKCLYARSYIPKHEKQGKLNMRVESTVGAGYSGLKAYREDKRKNGKLPPRPKKSIAR